MDKYLNEDAITAEIMSYVKNRIYNYAVLIDGDWGTGKTYFIQKSLIPNLESSGYMPIYISLYGINSTDTVSQKIALSLLTNKIPADKKAIAKQCLPAIGSFVLPIGQTLLNATGMSILEPLLKSPVEDIPWDTIFKKFSDSRKRIFIFDDLERCSLPINEILGYINSLVEHESEKVLIVANQKAIGKMSLHNNLEAKYQVILNPQLQLTEKVRDSSPTYFSSSPNLIDKPITSFTPEQLKQQTASLFSENVLYKEIKEKLVGQELYFRPTLAKTIPQIINESYLDDDVKTILSQSVQKIVNVFILESYTNLRCFQAALLTLNRIWNLNFDKDIDPRDRHVLLEDLFIAILHTTIQQKRGGARMHWSEGKSYDQCTYSKSPLHFARYFMSFKFIEDYIFESQLNRNDAVATINAYVQNEVTAPREKKNDPIQKIGNYYLMDDSQVEQLYQELVVCVGTHSYTLVELIKLLSFAYNLLDLGFSVDVNQLYLKIENSISKFEIMPTESIRFFETSMFDGSFLNPTSPHYSKFKYQCNNLLIMLKRKNSTNESAELSALINTSDSWGRKLYEYTLNNKEAFLSEGAFLSKMDTDVIADKLLKSPPNDWQDFRRCLSLVYNFANLNDYFSEDLENAEELKRRLESIVLPDKILNNIHKKWLIEDLKEIISKLTPQASDTESASTNTVSS